MRSVDGKLIHLENRDFNNRLVYKFDRIEDGPLLAVDSSFHPGNPSIWSASRIYNENSERRFYHEYRHEKEFRIEYGKFDRNYYPGRKFTNTGWGLDYIPDGPICKFNEAGRTIAWYKNGEQYGSDSSFFPNGILRSVRPTEYSSPGAFFILNYPNGHRKEEGSYTDGLETGWWSYFNDSVSEFPSTKIHYVVNEYTEGNVIPDSVISFYKDGKIKSCRYSMYFKEYKPDIDHKKRKEDWEWMEKSVAIDYFPDGKTAHISYYNWDMQDTSSARWYSNGNIAWVNLKNGITREWYANGQLKSERISNGVGQIEKRVWDENGGLIQEK
jgi:antitoxin component YwqK of YwqJK toxin-antitoxin module